MSVSLALTLSLIYIAVLIGATFYNHIKERKTLFLSSAYVLGIFLVAHLGNSLWLLNLPLEKALSAHYLFFAGIQVAIAVGLFLINRKKLSVIMTTTIILLSVEALLGYAIHIDRNIVALNGAIEPNTAGSTKWILWDLRNYLSQITTLTIFLSVTLTNVYQVSKSLINTEAFIIWEDVDKYLATFNNNESLERAQDFMTASLPHLTDSEPGEARNRRITRIGITLLNEAIRESCYEPERIKPIGIFGRFVYWLRS